MTDSSSPYTPLESSSISRNEIRILPNVPSKLVSLLSIFFGILLVPSLLFGGWYCFVLFLWTVFGSIMSGKLLTGLAVLGLATGGTAILGVYGVIKLIVDATTALRPILIFTFFVLTITVITLGSLTPNNIVAMKGLWFIPIYINVTTISTCFWTLALCFRSRRMTNTAAIHSS